MQYLLESSLYMLFFFGIYQLLLARENTYIFNRFYLLSSLVLALVFPLLDWSMELTLNRSISEYLPVFENQEHSGGAVVFKEEAFSWGRLIALGYLLGAGLRLLIVLRQMGRLVRNIIKGIPVRLDGYPLILLEGNVPPHSFLGYIFVSKAQYADRQLEDALLQHEWAHVRQRHSYDLLVLGLLSVFYWFNPILRWYRNAIQLNHEHLSDRAVLRNGTSLSAYQQLLFKNIATYSEIPMASPLQFSLTKKRFEMMPKHLLAPQDTWKRLLILPLSLFIFLIFNITLTGQVEPRKIVIKEAAKQEKVAVQPPIPPIPSKGFVEKHPTAQHLEDWQNTKEYGVWLDNKRIDNQALAAYKSEDLGWFQVSKLRKNAKNYGKHTYQVTLYSLAYYNKHLKVRVVEGKTLPVLREIKQE